jgi:hypothetical protein
MRILQSMSMGERRRGAGGDGQDGHEDGEPEFLGAEQGVSTCSPLAEFDVVGVTHYDEYPCCLIYVSTTLECG